MNAFLESIWLPNFTEKAHNKRMKEVCPGAPCITYEDMRQMHERLPAMKRSIDRHIQSQKVLEAVYHPIQTARNYFSKRD